MKEFTEREKEFLEEMIAFPEAYKLTPTGEEVVRGLYEKLFGTEQTTKVSE